MVFERILKTGLILIFSKNETMSSYFNHAFPEYFTTGTASPSANLSRLVWKAVKIRIRIL